jgi:hypothetical protein
METPNPTPKEVSVKIIDQKLVEIVERLSESNSEIMRHVCRKTWQQRAR